jgi:hypothetical protein
MARSSLLALCVLVAACSSSVVPPLTVPPSPVRTTLTPAPRPFNEAAIHYADTFRAFVAAYDAGRYDDALALIDDRFLFGVDCDYEARKFWYITDHDSATYWLRIRLGDHDRIDIVRFVEVPTGVDSAIGVEVVRSSDTIRQRGYVGAAVRPRVPMVVRFSLDGLRITQIGYVFSAPLPTFADCTS